MTSPELLSGTSTKREQSALPAATGVIDILYLNAPLLIFVAFFAAYVPPMLRTLWTDEASMFWMARGGPAAVMHKVWVWPGQSILYSLITSLFCFQGSPARDVILRLPALLGTAAAAYFVFRFAEDAIGRGAGRMAAVAFAFHPVTIEFATQARPYAPAVAAAVASCWTLFRWAERRERKWLISYAASLTLMLYLHYMFAVILVPHAALIGWEVRQGHRGRLRELIWAYLGVGALFTPLIPHLLWMGRLAHTIQRWDPPESSGPKLAQLLVPYGFMAGCVAAFVLILVLRKTEGVWREAGSQRFTVLLLVWWSFGPLLFYALSQGTSIQIFTGRYLAWSAPAFVMMLSSVAYSIFGSRAGLVWSLMAALLTTGNPIALAGHREPGPLELGPAMSLISQESQGQSPLPPVMARSDLTEANFGNWRAGNVPDSYLFTAFTAYPMPNELVPLPYRLDDDVRRHISTLIETRLATERKVIFITHDPSWVSWMDSRFEQSGFKGRWARPNEYYVGVFERAR